MKAKAARFKKENTTLKSAAEKFAVHSKRFDDLQDAFGDDWKQGISNQNQLIKDLDTQAAYAEMMVDRLQRDMAEQKLDSRSATQ